MAKNRADANAAYSKKHPGSKVLPRKDAPVAGRTVDRIDLIRQENDRVNKMHE